MTKHVPTHYCPRTYIQIEYSFTTSSLHSRTLRDVDSGPDACLRFVLGLFFQIGGPVSSDTLTPIFNPLQPYFVFPVVDPLHISSNKHSPTLSLITSTSSGFIVFSRGRVQPKMHHHHSVDSDGARGAWLDFLSQTTSQSQPAYANPGPMVSSRVNVSVKAEPQDEHKPQFSEYGVSDALLPSPVSFDDNPRSAGAGGGSGSAGPLIAMDMDMDFDIRDML
ncbi:hypothetical protein D9619_006919 [Psilocybe cf. subviscida]|uniref:Uncharacterized protein n=1 Tax=Psilocybe cf. subviscida TaxID=2480587 RepID=A0A8H5B5I6_9AGAR|nr:hypothetical protein D9619_006919 [Psilocybe cf. subviscida]